MDDLNPTSQPLSAAVSFGDESAVRALPVPADTHAIEYWHPADSYFGVRVCKPRANGRVSRNYIARYRDGFRWKKRTLGAVGQSGLSFGEARYRAYRLKTLGAAREGEGIPTFLEAYTTYCELCEDKWSESTKENYKKAMKRLEPWHHRELDRISAKDANDLFKEIRRKVCERRGVDSREDRTTGTVAAVGAMRLARVIFNIGREKGHITKDPLSDLIRAGKFRRSENRTPAIHATQLKAFWDWLHSESTATPRVVKDYLLIMLFTGMRRSVMGSLTWKNLDLTPGNEHYLMYPDQRGNKTRRLVPVPIATHLVEHVFKRRYIDPLRHDKWILPSPKKQGQPLVSVRGSLAAMEKATGIHATVHSLRATLATLIHATTGSLLVTRRALTHTVDSSLDRQTTASGYVVHTNQDLRIAVNATVATVLQMVGRMPTRGNSGSWSG